MTDSPAPPPQSTPTAVRAGGQHPTGPSYPATYCAVATPIVSRVVSGGRVIETVEGHIIHRAGVEIRWVEEEGGENE